jgi:hypothetical protein
MSKVVCLSTDGVKFQFSSGGLFQINFGVFQLPKYPIEILVNNSVIAKSVKGRATMLKIGDEVNSDFSSIAQNKENLKRNGEKRMKQMMGVTFQDYLVIEFGTWIGVRFTEHVPISNAQAFIKIVKI